MADEGFEQTFASRRPVLCRIGMHNLGPVLRSTRWYDFHVCSRCGKRGWKVRTS